MTVHWLSLALMSREIDLIALTNCHNNDPNDILTLVTSQGLEDEEGFLIKADFRVSEPKLSSKGSVDMQLYSPEGKRIGTITVSYPEGLLTFRLKPEFESQDLHINLTFRVVRQDSALPIKESQPGIIYNVPVQRRLH